MNSGASIPKEGGEQPLRRRSQGKDRGAPPPRPRGPGAGREGAAAGPGRAGGRAGGGGGRTVALSPCLSRRREGDGRPPNASRGPPSPPPPLFLLMFVGCGVGVGVFAVDLGCEGAVYGFNKQMAPCSPPPSAGLPSPHPTSFFFFKGFNGGGGLASAANGIREPWRAAYF